MSGDSIRPDGNLIVATRRFLRVLCRFNGEYGAHGCSRNPLRRRNVAGLVRAPGGAWTRPATNRAPEAQPRLPAGVRGPGQR
jgi:hypothetical protein